MMQRLISTTLIFGFALFSFAATPQKVSLESFAKLKIKVKELEQAIEKNEAEAGRITLLIYKLQKVSDQFVTAQEIKKKIATKEVLEQQTNALVQELAKYKHELDTYKDEASSLLSKAHLALRSAIKEDKEQKGKAAKLIEEIGEINKQLGSDQVKDDIKKALIIRKIALRQQEESVLEKIIALQDPITLYTRLFKAIEDEAQQEEQP